MRPDEVDWEISLRVRRRRRVPGCAQGSPQVGGLPGPGRSRGRQRDRVASLHYVNFIFRSPCKAQRQRCPSASRPMARAPMREENRWSFARGRSSSPCRTARKHLHPSYTRDVTPAARRAAASFSENLTTLSANSSAARAFLRTVARLVSCRWPPRNSSSARK